MDNASFKERVVEVSIEQAQKYYSVFVDTQYLICSDAFSHNTHYIISAEKDNYKHLIGINTDIGANDFFNKCLNGTLTTVDFNFSKKGRSEKEIKGSVRRKIKSLPFFNDMFSKPLLAQENFFKNGICCSLATSDSNITIGFANAVESRPKSLMWGNTLDKSKMKPVDLILRKHSENVLFDEIIYGNNMALEKYLPKIKDVVSENIIKIARI